MLDALREFFAITGLLVQTINAQAHFILGFAVLLQWRRESQLELARSVPLLAAFGLTTSLAIWADVFIPLQHVYFSREAIEAMRLGHALLYIVAYAFLLHFALRLNWSHKAGEHLPWLLAVLGSIIAVAMQLRGMQASEVLLWVQRLGRPLIVFPASLLAAWGLRREAEQIQRMGLPAFIVDWLRIAGFSFGFYAIVSGMFVPLSADGRTWFYYATGIPIDVFQAAVGMILAYAMTRALTIFRHELQRLVVVMGRERALAADRQRIGRELHDGTIQSIYGAGLVLENAYHLVRQDPETAERLIQHVMKTLDETIADIRRYIFDLAASEGALEELLGEVVEEFRASSGLPIDFRIEGDIPAFSAETNKHIQQMVREALSNVVKHAHASEASVVVRNDADAVRFIIADNGRGLPEGGAYRRGGRGVPNLLARAGMLGGHVAIRNRPEGGTVVEIVIPNMFHETSKATP